MTLRVLYPCIVINKKVVKNVKSLPAFPAPQSYRKVSQETSINIYHINNNVHGYLLFTLFLKKKHLF